MTDRLPRILDHLAPLVAADTRNPPRAITPDHPLVAAVRAMLPGFEVDVRDLGRGSLILDCRRGAPDVLFNVHLDTVPAAEGWSRDPHELLRGEDRAAGLGACDIKGAAAVLAALAETTDTPMRLVLTTDEEAGESSCVRTFLEDLPDVSLAVVAEPTNAEAVTRHRGIVSARAVFGGQSGHASQAGGRSAVHEAARWVADCASGDLAAETRLNFGRIEGGVKPNMVAASCEVLYGFRPRPGEDADMVLREIRGRAKSAEHTDRFKGPALPAGTARAVAAQKRASEIVQRLGLRTGAPVDFWTEASLFAEAGLPACVLGPGDIAQAHTADEWVSYDSLLATYDAYERIVAGV